MHLLLALNNKSKNPYKTQISSKFHLQGFQLLLTIYL
jgi:hypothetical protein